MTIGTRLFTLWKGRFVGRDQLGNRYYRERTFGRRHPPRRWVLFKGEREASRIPPRWHAWLHYVSDEAPLDDAPTFEWQREHQPNPTGTAEAYRPPGHDYRGGRRDRATGDYEPWRPS